MFEKLAALPEAEERLEIYNLLKFSLPCCRRLAEFLALGALIAGGGWFIGRLQEPAGATLPKTALIIGLMLLAAGLPRWLLLPLESELQAGFGLDPRPRAKRLAALAARELRWLSAVWGLSVLLFWGLTVMEIWLWTLAALALGSGLLLLDAFHPRLLRPQSLRPLQDGELTPLLLCRLRHWCLKAGLKAPAFRVDTSFSLELSPPRLIGLGPTLALVIPEKALACFTPREIALLTGSAMVERLVKAPLKFLCLRFAALIAAICLAPVFLGTLGGNLWLYPLSFNPALVTLIWLSAWLGLVLGEFSTRLTRRELEIQLANAAVHIFKDEEALAEALTTLAAKNLEEASPPSWRELFGRRFSRSAFLKRFQARRQLTAFSKAEKA
ncbi:hypothetical protein FACS189460_2810 [Deltaproteobacteria bacterium]|nr:hypothetical protein FACS189460_2810 [Deltaproteobacteria bacterium]